VLSTRDEESKTGDRKRGVKRRNWYSLQGRGRRLKEKPPSGLAERRGKRMSEIIKSRGQMRQKKKKENPSTKEQEQGNGTGKLVISNRKGSTQRKLNLTKGM